MGELTTLLEGCPIYDTVKVTDAWVEVADPVDRPWKVGGGVSRGTEMLASVSQGLGMVSGKVLGLVSI